MSGDHAGPNPFGQRELPGRMLLQIEMFDFVAAAPDLIVGG
jgi:hypothetical protein